MTTPMQRSAASAEARAEERVFHGEAVEEAGAVVLHARVELTRLAEELGQVGRRGGHRHDEREHLGLRLVVDLFVDDLLVGPVLGEVHLDARDAELEPLDVAVETRHLDVVVGVALGEIVEALHQVDLALHEAQLLDLELVCCDLEVEALSHARGQRGVAGHSNFFLLQEW